MNKKFATISGLVIGIVTFAILGGCGNSTVQDAKVNDNNVSSLKSEEIVGFTKYSNPASKFTIQYPTDWTTEGEEIDKTSGSYAIAFLPPLKDGESKGANVFVFAKDMSSDPQTLEQYTKLSLEAMKEAIDGPEIVTDSVAVLAGLPAHKFIIKGTQSGTSLEWYQLYTIKNDMLYQLTFTAEPNKYAEQIKNVEQMADTLEIL